MLVVTCKPNRFTSTGAPLLVPDEIISRRISADAPGVGVISVGNASVWRTLGNVPRISVGSVR